MNKRIIPLLLGSFSLLLTGLSVHADDEKAYSSGQQDFIEHCASCHGVDGKGGLEKFEGQVVKPGDLTRLSQENNGTFPYVKIRRIIDGRADQGRRTRAHMIGDMPVWGEVFASEKGSTASGRMHGEAIAKMRILDLVDYLVSIQALELE